MDCRGHIKRVNIVRNYTVTPVAHLKLLKGVTLPSDAGGDITDSYFIFECKNKFTGNSYFINCGRPTAVDFCKLTNQDLPPIFNPLRIHAPVRGSAVRKGKPITTSKWNDARLQLYNAVMLMIIKIGAKQNPDRPLFSIKKEVEKFPYLKPRPREIKGLTTILAKFHTTIPKVIDELSVNNDIRNYDFNALIEYINTINEPKYIKYFEL